MCETNMRKLLSYQPKTLLRETTVWLSMERARRDLSRDLMPFEIIMLIGDFFYSISLLLVLQASEFGATAKFETPRKKIPGKSPLIRPGSSGKENFALSRSAKKRAAALQRLQDANCYGAATINPALLTNTGIGAVSSYTAVPTSFDKMSLPMHGASGSGGGVVCSGGVCMLPSAFEGLKTNNARMALGKFTYTRVI